MVWTAANRSVNRRPGTILKGRRGCALDRVGVPSYDWLLSDGKQELYRFMEGNFEAFLDVSSDRFYVHHLLKVLPADAIPVLVGTDLEGYWVVEERLEWYWSESTQELF